MARLWKVDESQDEGNYSSEEQRVLHNAPGRVVSSYATCERGERRAEQGGLSRVINITFCVHEDAQALTPMKRPIAVPRSSTL